MPKKYEGSKVKLKILISSIIVSILLLTIAATAMKFLIDFTSTQTSIGNLINISGKQRMLTKKIILLIQSIHSQKNVASVSIIKNDLLNSIQDMKNSNETLIYGNMNEGIQKITNNETERLLHGKINLYNRVKEFLAKAEDNSKKNDYNEFLAEYNIYKINSLQGDLEKLSKIYTMENEQQSKKIIALTYIMTGSYVLLTFIIIFLIFRPVANSIARSFIKLEDEIYKQKNQIKILEIESKISQNIFQNLLPRIEYIENFNSERISLAAFSQNAKEISKDWWGIYEFDKTKVVVIGEVLGLEKSSELVVKAISQYFENIAQQNATEKTNFLDIFKHLNSAIQEFGTTNQLELTLSILIFNQEINRVKFINAGHLFPYLIEYAEKDKIKISRFKTKGHSLGLKNSNNTGNEEEIKIAEYEFNNNSALLLFTNGLINNKNPENTEYNEKSLKKFLEKNNFKTVNALLTLEQIIFDAYQFYGKQNLTEDVTCILIKKS